MILISHKKKIQTIFDRKGQTNTYRCLIILHYPIRRLLLLLKTSSLSICTFLQFIASKCYWIKWLNHPPSYYTFFLHHVKYWHWKWFLKPQDYTITSLRYGQIAVVKTRNIFLNRKWNGIKCRLLCKRALQL